MRKAIAYCNAMAQFPHLKREYEGYAKELAAIAYAQGGLESDE